MGLIPIGSRIKPPATSTVDAQQFTSTIGNHGAGVPQEDLKWVLVLVGVQGVVR